MDPGVVAALVAAGASIVVAIVGAVYAQITQTRVKRLEGEQKRQQAAEEVLARYSEPLAEAAFDLASRLRNLLDKDFLQAYGAEGAERRDDALRTTLYRFARYFGWRHILQREIQYLKFENPAATREVRDLVTEVMLAFNTDELGQACMVWKDDQQAIGELMLEEGDGPARCIGYAEFARVYAGQGQLRTWLSPVENDLEPFATWGPERDDDPPPAAVRLQLIQWILCDLVRALDPNELQYPATALGMATRPLSTDELNEVRQRRVG